MAEERRHEELRRLADDQWRVLSLAQIRQAGFSSDEITGLIRRCVLYRAHRAVYYHATLRPPPRGVLLAALWSCPDGAYLTGRTALSLHRVCGMYLGRIEIGLPHRSVRGRRAPIRLTTTSAPPVRLRHDGPLAYATVPQALWDLAAAGTDADALRRLIREAIHLGRFDHAEMRALMDAHAGCPGIAALREAYRHYLPRDRSRSGLERSFDAGRRLRSRIPEPVPNTVIEAGGIRWEIDRYWPEAKVALELHGGGYHQAAEDIEKDSFKAAQLARLGILVVVITDVRWELEPDACLDDLEAILLARGLAQVS